MRAVLAVGVAGAGWFVIAQTYAQVVRVQDPALAWRLAPWDGRNGAAYADRLIQPPAGGLPSTADLARAEDLARAALRRDPTAVDAAAALTTIAQLQGQPARADRLFTYAERLTRRNLPTQLWAIEAAVGRGDIANALHHYDITFRTMAKAPELLFPVLANAVGNAEISGALIKTLTARPAWAGAFIGYMAGYGPDPIATANFFTGLRTARVPIPASAQALLVNSLVAKNQLDEAWTLYSAGQGMPSRNRSRDPRFASTSLAPTQFDWNVGAAPGITATIQRAGNAGLLNFAASANAGGILVQQLQMLPNGSYRLSGHSIGIDQPDGARPYWTLRCYPDGRELGRVVVPNSAQGGGKFAGSLDVPAGCAVQTLALVAQPSEAIGGVTGQIDRVDLAALR